MNAKYPWYVGFTAVVVFADPGHRVGLAELDREMHRIAGKSVASNLSRLMTRD
jgi:hypothetical protein